MSSWANGQAALARRALRNEKALEALGFTPTSVPTLQPSRLQHVVINTNTAGVQDVIRGSDGASIEIWALQFWSAGNQDLDFLEDTETLMGPFTGFPGGTGFLLPLNARADEPWFTLDPGKSLKISLSAAAQVSGFVKFRTR